MGNEKVDLISVAKPEKKTLLERYNIPITDLSYEFISECTNERTLERIVLILRSGEEGVYPDLTRHAEERLAKIKPTSTVLRKAEPILRRSMLDTDEQREIDNDIDDWTCKMQSCEKDLDERKATLIGESSPQLEIRKTKLPQNTSKKINEKKRVKSKRISSCDYAAWDKYDADTEINRIDLQDEQRQAEMKRIQERQKELDKMNKTTHKTTVDKLSLTGTELEIMAAQEREKGNEAFKAADYEEALRHYNASIEVDSNLMSYNNRAMTLIKLQRYEDALNDCNMVLSMDYTNVKALLRRALSLEHLEKAHQALADYEAVLKLEPTNEIAISGVNKLRKADKSRKIMMKIEEENISDGEDKAESIKPSRTVEMNSIERPKQRVNSDICYCDRAPGSSRNVATKPHVKASYCVESESNKAAMSATDVAANESRKTTRVSTNNDKLSPVANDLGGNNKTSNSRANNGDTSTIPCGLFSGSRGVESNLKKSIFSCTSSPCKGRSSVIIEELPSDESWQVCEEPKNIINSRETRVGTRKEMSLREEKNTITKKSSINKEIVSTEKKSKTTTSSMSDKIQIANGCRIENGKLEIDDQRLENIESPYEFLRLWYSLKSDTDLKLHAKLLRLIVRENMNKFIGNKLDATMFSLILRCLEQQFCVPKDAELLADLLYSLSELSRFSIVYMFMDSKDKKAVQNILRFLDKEGSPKISQLRQIYVNY